jgi:hypothetical protein
MYIELTIRNVTKIEEIAQQILSLPFQVTHIGLTNKNGMPDTIEVLKEMKKFLPEVAFTPYYSFKNHTNKDPEVITNNFDAFIEDAKELDLPDVLLISGEPKPKFEILKGLEHASIADDVEGLPALSVVFNPFLEGEDLIVEQTRLIEKLQFDFVKNIYLQIGFDEKKLKSGVSFLRKQEKNVAIFGSVFVPTAHNIKKFDAQPWKGVVFPEEFTSSLETAIEMSRIYTKMIKKMDITALYSINVITDDGVENLGKISQ